ncbi:YwqG family protein [Bacillus taeanensis]|uniref:DUF1963 domain-containing protein n=1 Tax=Bacillus taeanensis TaxID=273032 RepID=A0A366XRL7_9BACI|nr:YwqG family protein [Bacillus taeanensis]RBW68178.1 DUF1963 domain-containing protein [Bacillus taeanensis]
MGSHIESLIKKHGLEHVKDDILDGVFSCIAVKPERAEHLPLGASKMGGVPDLPQGEDYPMYKGKPLHFIGQFNLKEIAELNIKTEIPKEGMLYFFYYDDWEDEEIEGVWGEKEQKDGWRVIYYNGDNSALEPRDQGIHTYPQCKINFEVVDRLPFMDFDDDDDFDRYDELSSDLLPNEGTIHQIEGYPHAVQGEVFEECGGYAEKSENEEDWTLLFQVDSDEENLEMMWGDVGMLYFCILTEDLKNRRFEEAWCVMQCH